MSARKVRKTVDEPLRLLTLTLGGDPSTVPVARRALEDVLRQRYAPAEFIDAVLLVASELVTNAVEHGGGADRLELDWEQTTVLLRVWDRGTGRPQPRAAGPSSARGRGLTLVEALSEEWGCEPRSGDKFVWSRLSLISA